MKALLSVAFLFALGMFITPNEVKAQQSVGNKTNCDMIFAYEYGVTGTCVVAGYNQVNVPAGTAIPVLPAGMEIIRAKGTYALGGCNAFYVGIPCSTYPMIDNVACGSACGNFIGQYFPGWGVIAHQ